MESLDLLNNRLESERAWLSLQPNFQDGWEEGCRWAVQRAAALVDEYALDLLTPPLSPRSLSACHARLWSAWGYHWRQAADALSSGQIDGEVVAQDLRHGVRPTTGHFIGGDPLRDTVLAEGCLEGDRNALERLHQEYRDVFERESRESLHREPDLDQWHDLIVRLIGADRSDDGPRRLDRFLGFSSLRVWLRPVVRHFLWDSFRSEQARRAAELRLTTGGLAGERVPVESTEVEDSLELFREQVAGALARLPAQDRLLLFLHFRQGWPNHVIAEHLQRSAGQISRLRQSATERFCQEVRDALQPGWLDELRESDPILTAYFLLRGLDELPADAAVSEGQEPEEEDRLMAQKTDRKKMRRKKPAVKRPAAKKPAAKKSAAVPIQIPRSIGRHQKKQPGEEDRSRSDAVEPILGVKDAEIERSLDRLLPNALEKATTGDGPEKLLPRLRALPPSDRPGVICLDARSASPADVVAWLERFDAVVYEPGDGGGDEPWEPRRVIFLSGPALRAATFADWRTRPDIHWVPTKDERTDVEELYRRHLQTGLRAFLQPNLKDIFSSEADEDAEPATKYIPAEMQEAWQTRIDELDTPGDDD